MGSRTKGYGQFPPTTQESYAGNFVSVADFNRAYFRLNANIGRVFKFDDSNIKPFVGTNYYFTHTPSYIEKNGGAYTASFVGSSTPSFSIKSQNTAKTYAQIIVGGAIDFSDRLSINLA